MRLGLGLGMFGLGTWSPPDEGSLLWWLRPDQGITLAATPLASGTSPPVSTLSGNLNQSIGLQYQIDSVAGGTSRGQATFKWSLDNGATYAATGVLTAATVAIGTTGIVVNFPVGTYGTDQVWKAAVAQIADLSGNGRTAKATDQGVAGAAGAANDARAPLLKVANSLYNGRATLNWPVGNTLPMLNTDTFGAALSVPITYIFVCHMSNQANAKNLMNVANDSAQVTLRHAINGTAATTMGMNSVTIVSGSATITSPVIIAAVLGTTTGSFSLNGVSKFTGNPGTAGPKAWRLGRAQSGSTTSSLEGDIAQVIAYAGILSVAAMNRVLSNLGAYYNQAVTLS